MGAVLNKGESAAGPVRLLVVNPSPVRGGAEELLAELCARSTALSITVACLADGPFPDDLARAGARVARVPAGRLRNPVRWFRSVLRLARLARAHDVVISWQVKGHYYGTPAALLARRPHAWWDHGIRPARGEPRYLIDNLLPRLVPSSLVVCSSYAAAARHRHGIAIHPGVSCDVYEQTSREEARASLGAAPEDLTIGIVGRLQPWKGQHDLLRAAPEILRRFPGARFFIIGGTPGGFSAPYPGQLRDLAERLGIAGHVTFLGQRDDVSALLPGLDVFVHASSGEPFGMVIAEAMAAGVPVVVHAGGGVGEIASDGAHGLLWEGTSDALASAVCRYLDDPAFAARIAHAGRRRARERFSIERYVGDVGQLVRRLAGERMQ